LTHAPSKRLPWIRLAAYGSISLPLATIGLPLSIYLAPFYSGELGVPLGLLGVAMILARLTDVITDPLIGAASDRIRTPWGRRRVWIPFGSALLMFGCVQLFMPDMFSILGEPSVWTFAAWLTLVYLGFTFVQLPHSAWGGELSNDYFERTRIFSVRQFFTMAGLILATALPAWVLSRPGAGAGDVLQALSVLMLVLLPICVVLVTVFTPEPKAPASEAFVGLFRGARIVLRNGPFRIITLALFLGYVAETFRITITLFFARDVIGVPNIGLVYAAYFAVGLAAVPFWTWLAGRIGKHRALACALVVVAVTNISVFFLEHGQVALFTAIFMFKGMCFGALELVPASLVADAVDVDTARSRSRRQGLFFAFVTMTNKIGQAFGQGMSLIFLSLVGYNAAGETDPENLLWMRALYALLPVVILAPAIWLMWRYRFTAARHTRLREAMARREAREARA
jgi:glycoside/pentoside/hexuronide:cation symporter, GPH family